MERRVRAERGPSARERCGNDWHSPPVFMGRVNQMPIFRDVPEEASIRYGKLLTRLTGSRKARKLAIIQAFCASRDSGNDGQRRGAEAKTCSRAAPALRLSLPHRHLVNSVDGACWSDGRVGNDGELHRRHREDHLLSVQFGFHSAMALLFHAIVEDDIAHNAGAKVGHRDQSMPAIRQPFLAHHIRSADLVPECLRRTCGRRRRSILARRRVPICVTVRVQQNKSEFHTLAMATSAALSVVDWVAWSPLLLTSPCMTRRLERVNPAHAWQA